MIYSSALAIGSFTRFLSRVILGGLEEIEGVDEVIYVKDRVY